jgi:hypothetical protein
MQNKRTSYLFFTTPFFEKNEFRPGQLPILDRALQNLPVVVFYQQEENHSPIKLQDCCNRYNFGNRSKALMKINTMD